MSQAPTTAIVRLKKETGLDLRYTEEQRGNSSFLLRELSFLHEVVEVSEDPDSDEDARR